jgi:hypothetical protein
MLLKINNTREPATWQNQCANKRLPTAVTVLPRFTPPARYARTRRMSGSTPTSTGEAIAPLPPSMHRCTDRDGVQCTPCEVLRTTDEEQRARC